jgi:hypothetical protein
MCGALQPQALFILASAPPACVVVDGGWCSTCRSQRSLQSVPLLTQTHSHVCTKQTYAGVQRAGAAPRAGRGQRGPGGHTQRHSQGAALLLVVNTLGVALLLRCGWQVVAVGVKAGWRARCLSLHTDTIQCNAMQCNTLQCNTMQHNAMQCTMPTYTLQVHWLRGKDNHWRFACIKSAVESARALNFPDTAFIGVRARASGGHGVGSCVCVRLHDALSWPDPAAWGLREDG